MGWRFRRSIKLFPGLKINFSKSGISTTVGTKGASVTFGPNGTSVNTSIPGTGLYRRDKVPGSGSTKSQDNSYSTQEGFYKKDYQLPNKDSDLTPEKITEIKKEVIRATHTISVKKPETEPFNMDPNAEPYNPRLDLANYKFPTLDLLKHYDYDSQAFGENEQETNKSRIIKVLLDFGIELETISYTVGPTTILYEITLAPGIHRSKLAGLEEDIAFALCVDSVNLILSIPNKGTIGIVVPNQHPCLVSMESVLSSSQFTESNMELPIALGKTQTNETFVFDLAKSPNILISGSTGKGKSVALNVIITSLLFKKHPAEVKFVLMDPYGVEFGIYEILKRHFLASLPKTNAVITNSSDAVSTLYSLCTEMESRIMLLKDANARSVQDYNYLFTRRQLNPAKGHRYLPYIVVVIDSYNTLAMENEERMAQYLSKLTKFARVTGIHLVISSIRPTNDILPSEVKSNFTTRISFRVPEMIDSQVILDCNGAEMLSSTPGDMLYRTGSDTIRLQCAFVDTPEVNAFCQYISRQQGYLDAYPLPEYVDPNERWTAEGSGEMEKFDPLFAEAARLVVINQSGSTSLIQRKFAIGYHRAGRLMDQLEVIGIVGKAEGSNARPVLVTDEVQLDRILEAYNLL